MSHFTSVLLLYCDCAFFSFLFFFFFFFFFKLKKNPIDIGIIYLFI